MHIHISKRKTKLERETATQEFACLIMGKANQTNRARLEWDGPFLQISRLGQCFDIDQLYEALRKAFHEVAITQARPPVDKGGMNPKSDSYEANYSPLYKYDADLDKYVETEKGVKERSLRELRRENE